MERLLIDPHRAAMFKALEDLRGSGLRRVMTWSHRDGLPVSAAQAHQHAMPTVALGLIGTTRIVGRTVIDLAPGDLLLIEPGCWHVHTPQLPGTASFGLGFLAQYADVLFFNDRETIWGAIPEHPTRFTVDALMDATREGERLERADQLVREVLAEQIRFVDWCHPDVLQMAAYLWNHLHLDFAVEEIMGGAEHGRTASFALFRRFFGRSPRQELIHQRLELARHLVRRGVPVTEAAARSGFRTRADFTRAHRQRFGGPPVDLKPVVPTL